MATPLDTALIGEYTRGVNVPVASQAGYSVRADEAGTNIEYIGPQELTGSGTWDGKADTIMVRGSGARTITLGNGYFIGQRVAVVDADGTSGGGGTITVVATGSMAGDQTLTFAYREQAYRYMAEGIWACCAGAV